MFSFSPSSFNGHHSHLSFWKMNLIFLIKSLNSSKWSFQLDSNWKKSGQKKFKSNHLCSFKILNIFCIEGSISCVSVFICEGERQRERCNWVSGNLTKAESLSTAGRSDPLSTVPVCQNTSTNHHVVVRRMTFQFFMSGLPMELWTWRMHESFL